MDILNGQKVEGDSFKWNSPANLMFYLVVILLCVAFGRMLDSMQTFTMSKDELALYKGDVHAGCEQLITDKMGGDIHALKFVEQRGNALYYLIDQDSFGPGGFLLKIGFKPDWSHQAFCEVKSGELKLIRLEKVAVKAS